MRFTFYSLLSFLFLLVHNNAFSQKDLIKISGRIIDADNNTPLVGATIVLGAGTKGVNTDVEGNFFLQAEKGKRISLKVTNIGYQPKLLSDMLVSEDSSSNITIAMQKSSSQLAGVVVSSSARRENINSLYTAQKNSSAISDAISAEVIKKSPDRNTSEVLRRVSGTSIQDNKFVVVRGLSERYNASLLNNTTLPSTEPDKKAFSFDIIPSSLIDNVTIFKSPTPDLPGDFAGGTVKISTKDYPSKSLSEISFSAGYNSLTTFKNFYSGYPNGSLDWLGFFDNSRLMPGSYARHRGAQFINLSDESKLAITKQFPNTYGYQTAYKSQPNLSVSYTGGNTHLINGSKKIGYIYSVSYNNGRRVADRSRDEYSTYALQDYRYNTTNYDMRSTLSALLNVTYAFGKNKISFKNLFNNDFVKTAGIRNGYSVVNTSDRFLYKSANTEAAGNGILNSLVEGIHSLNKGLTIDWNASYGLTYRWQPDQRILTFHTDPNQDNYYLSLANQNSPEITNAGRVYSFLTENIYGANLNVTKQFTWLGETQKLKFGSANYYRDRDVQVDALGFSSLSPYGTKIPETKNTTFSTIFSPANIDAYQVVMANIGTNSTDYTGTALLNAGYVMLDNKFSDKVKLTWGARGENYAQELNTKGKQDIKRNNFDILPSLLFTYALSNKANLRVAASQSVNRPEFRELATYRVYDYENNFIVSGNDRLVRSKNTNADLRYEWFPAPGEIVSASVFYKHFKNPIEQTNQGNDVLSFANADNANVYGLELELRKKLDFISSPVFSHLVFYSNLAYIKGSVQFNGLKINSPLQGQSPYLINGGLSYSSENGGFSVNALYNRIGPRLKFRAIGGAGKNIFEKPRDVVDVQVSKKLVQDKLELKLTVSDIFAQAFTWYYKYDVDPSKTAYNPSTDRIINSYKYGTTTTISVRYSFGK
ncbi:MAG: TonB-dependent receptor [Williamsia sp.]|nr:TonB-dependent receptor [Williamsia sp.]